MLRLSCRRPEIRREGDERDEKREKSKLFEVAIRRIASDIYRNDVEIV